MLLRVNFSFNMYEFIISICTLWFGVMSQLTFREVVTSQEIKSRESEQFQSPAKSS